jgi:transcription termination factor Rho
MNGTNGQYPQGQEGQASAGGGRRRFRRNRRGGRGRRGKGGHGQGQVPAPLDAQGRIVDVENDTGPEAMEAAPPEGNVAPPQAPMAEGQPAAAAEVPQVGGDGQPARPPQQQPPQQRPSQQQRPQQQPRHEPAQPIDGVLDIDHRGNGRLRNPRFNFLPQQDDPDVPRHMIDRDRLRAGVYLTGQAVRRNGRLQLVKTDSVEGIPPQDAARRTAFQNLTVIDPDDRVVLETTSKELLTRVIDIVAPIGLGQRMLIVAPPKTGKTIMLQKICHAITENRPEVNQMVLLVDERPEEVTDFRRTVKAEVYASSSDRPTDEHIHVAEVVLERAKRLVEGGKDVVILLDSITRLSRAYNKEVESSGRTLSGGIDSRALEKPKRFFGAARNAEEGGSLTIVATALIDTGSRMDEVIFEEFKGTGNSEINLDRQLAEKRIFPAINIQTSGTRKEEKLFSQHEYEKVKKLRGALFALKPVEAMERLLKSLNEFKSNAEFLDAI